LIKVARRRLRWWRREKEEREEEEEEREEEEEEEEEGERGDYPGGGLYSYQQRVLMTHLCPHQIL